MQKSRIGSWQTKNYLKGNHRRKIKMAILDLGVIRNTYDTPSLVKWSYEQHHTYGPCS